MQSTPDAAAFWARLKQSLSDLVHTDAEVRARAAFVLDDDGAVVLAVGSFETQIVHRPPRAALLDGWASTRSASGELLVFVQLDSGHLLAGVFDGNTDAFEARALLEGAAAASTTLQ